ncbi:zinc metalloprotease [Nitratireductor aestuarii]|uniref:Zinc metalloprotease n=1 Tax=Nitratireductor aestuarii TaxID=1735103 RepID=A0A916VZ26_9HYPH|nr:RIP metalloprotease RseP [Nitratireductor aestuarii]GGA54079.1 zinc metalloprotease [Nitratireductor aestuarii]
MTDISAIIPGLGSFLFGTLVPFFFVLLVVVFVHEMGHFIAGRLCGIGVQAFSIGFGPEIFGYTAKNGTRWRLAAIPLGGYVKFVGDMSATSASVDEQALSKLSEAERRVAFHTQPLWKRAITVFAGPFANFVLGAAVFAAMFAIYGQYVYQPTVAEVRPNSPAAEAGILPGDTFISVDGVRVASFADVQRIVTGRAGDPLKIVLERDGREIETVATPEVSEQPTALGQKVRIGLIGVVTNEAVGKRDRIEYGPLQAVVAGIQETGDVIARTGQFMKRFVAGREDRCQLGGPVRIADMAGRAAGLGFEWLVQLVALLSVGIGILNLLPIPPLDGGHLMLYAAEAIVRRPIPAQVTEAVYRVGMLMVLAFMMFVFWNDLFGC